MRYLVCGGRYFTNAPLLNDVLCSLNPRPSVIIEGGQRTKNSLGQIVGGADFWAYCWGSLNGIDVLTEEADWKKHGRAAGPIRNKKMLSELVPDAVIAFPGGNGTADCVKQANSFGIKVVEVRNEEHDRMEAAC